MTKKQQLFFLGFFLLAALLIVAMLSIENSDKQLKKGKINSINADSLDSNKQIAAVERFFINYNAEQINMPFILNLGNMRLQIDTIPGELDSIFNRFLAEHKDEPDFSYEITEKTPFNFSVQHTKYDFLEYFQRDAYLKIKNGRNKGLKLPVFYEGFWGTFEYIKRPALKNAENLLIYGTDQAMCGGIGIVSIMLIKKDGIVELGSRHIFYDDSDIAEAEGMSKAELKAIYTEYDTIEKFYLPYYQDDSLVFRGVDLEIPREEQDLSYYPRKIPDNLNPADIYILEKTVIRTKSNHLDYYEQDVRRVTDYFYQWDGNKSVMIEKITR